MKPVQLVFDAIGTRWVIDVFASIPKKTLMHAVLTRIEAFDCVYSRFCPDSLVTQMATRKGTYTLPEDGNALLELYHTLYKLTDGKVTPLIGSVLEQAGYDASYSLQPKQLQTPLTWDEALLYQHPTLTIKKPTMLDFGAAGKGYLADIIGHLLEGLGCKQYCIDAGGDILMQLSEPLRIGLEHPAHPQQVIGVATIQQGSICGSSGNRRAWQGFHHIIDPFTLTSPTHVRAVWVVAKTARIADAIATCLFFVPPEKLYGQFTFEYVLLDTDYRIARSEAFPGEFFYAN